MLKFREIEIDVVEDGVKIFDAETQTEILLPIHQAKTIAEYIIDSIHVQKVRGET